MWFGGINGMGWVVYRQAKPGQALHPHLSHVPRTISKSKGLDVLCGCTLSRRLSITSSSEQWQRSCTRCGQYHVQGRWPKVLLQRPGSGPQEQRTGNREHAGLMSGLQAFSFCSACFLRPHSPAQWKHPHAPQTGCIRGHHIPGLRPMPEQTLAFWLTEPSLNPSSPPG